MKTIRFYFTLLGGLALFGQACGQDNRSKLRNDPTYSTHNYKHANKAAVARQWETKPGVAVQQPSTPAGQSNLANYKRQAPNQVPVGGITVGHTPSTGVADRNYKIQRSGQSTGLPVSGVAGRKKNRPDSSAVMGD